MSVFTNRASSASSNAGEYVAAVLELLGDQNAICVLRQTAQILERTLHGLRPEQIVQPEAVGKWSIRDVCQHLSDSELVFGYRLRMVLAHDRPPLTGYDQDLFASRLDYARVDAPQALNLFRTIRESNLMLAQGASDEDLRRTGVHAERGEQTLGEMIRLWAGHDLVHLRQVERICGTFTR